MRFQIQPYRLPILGRGFHHNNFDAALLQPGGHMSPFAGSAAKASPLVLDPLAGSALDDHLGYGRRHHHQNLLVYIDCSHFLSHTSLFREEWQNTRLGKATHCYALTALREEGRRRKDWFNTRVPDHSP